MIFKTGITISNLTSEQWLLKDLSTLEIKEALFSS